MRRGLGRDPEPGFPRDRFVGRGYSGLDSIVLVEGGTFEPGDFVNVRCIRSRDYDLVAKPLTSALEEALGADPRCAAAPSDG